VVPGWSARHGVEPWSNTAPVRPCLVSTVGKQDRALRILGGGFVSERAFESAEFSGFPVEAAFAVDRDVEFLRRGRWFGSLPAELQSLIVERSMLRSYRKGAHIVGEGSPPRGLFALLDGRVHIVRGVGESDEALIHVAEPGFWFGEHGMLSGKPAIATIVATVNARVLLLPTPEFQRIVNDEPRHYPHFATLLYERYATVFRYASEARAVAAEDWLWTRLQDLAAIRRRDAQLRGPIDINVSQAELAMMVGVSRQTLCMLLRRLEERGVIEVAYKKIRVLPATTAAAPRR
jgi:CRP/FNR family transcriptional regulator, cyclic AMP receptor protein